MLKVLALLFPPATMFKACFYGIQTIYESTYYPFIALTALTALQCLRRGLSFLAEHPFYS